MKGLRQQWSSHFWWQRRVVEIETLIYRKVSSYKNVLSESLWDSIFENGNRITNEKTCAMGTTKLYMFVRFVILQANPISNPIIGSTDTIAKQHSGRWRSEAFDERCVSMIAQSWVTSEDNLRVLAFIPKPLKFKINSIDGQNYFFLY